MTRQEGQALEIAVSRLADRLHQEPRLQTEAQRARRDFFGSEGAARPQPASAEFRFAEWFVLERQSEVLGAVPVTVPSYAASNDLADSLAGVFLVSYANEDEVVATDLQGDEAIELAVPEGSLLAGDLVVGRLYNTSLGHRPSSAASVFRPGASLADAFLRDVERLALGRRLHQIELEHLLLRRPEQGASPTAEPERSVPLERLEADLDQVLLAGASKHSASDVSQQLSTADRPGQVIGPLLESWAFDTKVDLDRARQLMFEIWNAWLLRRGPSTDTPPPAPPGASLGERLVQTLDDGLRRRRDVDEVFAQLERMAGLDAGAADEGDNPFDRDEEEDDEVPAQRDLAAGNLHALVLEYLWESGRGEEPGAAALRLWSNLQANAALPNLDIETVTSLDLTRLLLQTYLGAAAAQRAALVHATFAELGRFYAWIEETQELGLPDVLAASRSGLLEQVDRLAQAGELLSRVGELAHPEGTSTGQRPLLLRIEDLGKDGFGVQDDDGESYWLRASAAELALLRVGDVVLGAVARKPEGAALTGVVVVLPHDARALIE